MSSATLGAPRTPPPAAPGSQAGFGATLLLTATVAVAGASLLATVLVLALHPPGGYAFLAGQINQQNQTAKTAAYVLAFLAVLPAALIAVPRWIDRHARGPGAQAPAALASASFAAAIIVARLLHADLIVLLVVLVAWTAAMGGLAWRMTEGAVVLHVPWWASAGLIFVALLGLTRVGSLSVAGLLVGLGVAALVGLAIRRGWRLHTRLSTALELLGAVVLVAAVVDVVVFAPSPGPPNYLAMPGIVQSQHDYFLGPINQLLHHGTLLVNAPGSQYGVSDLYFIAAWFHIVPIGYGSFALLDGLLTAAFYLTAYLVLRVAGVARSLAALALAFAVCVFVYHLEYPVGVLPEMGPLRFGLPIVVLAGTVAATRWPDRGRLGRGLATAAVAVSSVWSVEACVYCVVTLVALWALQACLRAPGARRGWLLRQLAGLLGAIVAIQALFALATLAGSGSLPHWGQYFAYVNSFLLGGKAGEVTYGFDHFSPALALGALLLTAVAATVLLVRRAPRAVLADPVRFVAFGGATAYAVVLFSYTDNRSSTYLLPYLALPALLAVVLGVDWLWRAGATASLRRAVFGVTAAVAVVMLAAAWPTIGSHFSDSALAKARPGGGLVHALHRLAHPPAIDPRTPAGDALLVRYVPDRRPVVVLADWPDLAIELLMHAGRADGLSIGDSGMDSYVPQNWVGRIGREIDGLVPGTRMLTDTGTLALAATVAAHPGLAPLDHPLALGGNQMEWILQRLQRRFVLVPLHRDPSGLTVVTLRGR